MEQESLEKRLDCKTANAIRPVISGTRHYPAECIDCAKSLSEDERTRERNEIYSFQRSDFIPAVGVMTHALRTDLANDNPLSSEFEFGFGQVMLLAYNAGLIAAAYGIHSLFQPQ